MKEIIRIYIYPDGKETCVKDPETMVQLLSNLTEELDLDYNDSRGHTKAGTSQDLVGETVKVGTFEIEIVNH
jgi:hypothetical protein